MLPAVSAIVLWYYEVQGTFIGPYRMVRVRVRVRMRMRVRVRVRLQFGVVGRRCVHGVEHQAVRAGNPPARRTRTAHHRVRWVEREPAPATLLVQRSQHPLAVGLGLG